MGLLENGFWRDRWYNTEDHGGKFEREEAQFRNWITPDGSPGPTGKGGFAAERDRYHLYIAHACPWAHRTAIFRKLKKLDDIIGLSIVHWYMGAVGWTFRQDDHTIPDTVYNSRYLHQLYTRAVPDVTTRVTTPTLWDKKNETIVSNESADIIRMMNSAFQNLGAAEVDYYPDALQNDIDAINDRIYKTLNNGVYKCGFATSQKAYDKAVGPLFETLDWLESHLEANRYLCGDRITEADWRLFTTLIRFDAVYAVHFKCTKKRVADCPNLFAYTRELYQWPGIKETIVFDHIRKHYYGSHQKVNPHLIVPAMPEVDFDAPHGREAL